MQLDFMSGSPLVEAAWAVGIILVSALVAWSIVFGMHYVQHRLEGRSSRTALLPQLLQTLTRPVSLLIFLEGIIMAISTLSYLAALSNILAKAGVALFIILITYALTNSGGVLLSWYLRSRTVRRKARVDEGLIRFLRRMMAILTYAIGILIMLDYLQISITPIIAGLGIGGLAVALALQPTLGNFFASTQIVSDRVVRVGDYVELDNGTIRGYVVDVGWRSTRIRTPFNNLVIIPNSRLADSVVTNYFGPTMEMAVLVNCGVSYNADLLKVEAISLEVAKEVIQELDEADKKFEPWFGYEEFGDSNINFWVWLQANDRIASFRVKSEIIKRLKAALDKEGITINYPARLLTFERPNEVPPPFLPDKPGSGSPEKKR
ncbi:mechanosensitive ion channel family protein [Chloroflexota bacterium]